MGENIIDFRKRRGITKCACCGGAFGNSDHYCLCKKCWDDKLKSLPSNIRVKPHWELQCEKGKVIMDVVEWMRKYSELDQFDVTTKSNEWSDSITIKWIH